MTLFDMSNLTGLYPVESVANKFLELAAQSGKTLTNMQMQKLVYIAQGYSFALRGKALTFNTFEAWPHGPVCPHLYEMLKGYGSEPVKSQLTAIGGNPILSDDAAILIEGIWDSYGDFSAYKLREITHLKGTPWDKTGLYGLITDELTREYYSDLVQRNATE